MIFVVANREVVLRARTVLGKMRKTFDEPKYGHVHPMRAVIQVAQ